METNLASHIHLVGASQTGKTKLAEFQVRESIIHRQGACVIDLHGPLYDSLIDYCAFFNLKDRIIPLDLTSERVVGFPLIQQCSNPTAPASRKVSVLSEVYGNQKSSEAPKFREVGGLLFRLAIYLGVPIDRVLPALQVPKNKHLITAINRCYPPDKPKWQYLASLTTAKDWDFHTGSTRLRLHELCLSPAFPFLAGKLDLRETMDQGAIILVNLKQTPRLDAQSARDFAALLLSEFMFQAMQRHNDLPFTIYCDESQEYLTPQVGEMLDQMLKFGLRLAIIHHHLSQIEDEHLLASILEHCRIRFIFGGMESQSCETMAKLMFMRQIAEPMVRETRKRLITHYVPEAREITTTKGDQTSTTVAPGYAPVQEIVDDSYWYTQQEKIAIFSSLLHYQEQRMCYYQSPGINPVPIAVPYVREYKPSTKQRETYLMKLYKREGKPISTPNDTDEKDYVE